MTPSLLLDTSAWTRLAHPALPPSRAKELAEATEALRLHVSLPFLLEVGYTARNGTEHAQLMGHLLELPHAELDASCEARAIAAQRQLAVVGHHRLPPVDLLIAALAERHELSVLHYDRDFDILAEKTDLSFESVWLAEPGLL